MPLGNNMDQTGGDDAEMYQAGRDVNVYRAGLSVADVSFMLERAMRENAFAFRAVAEEVFNDRIHEFAEKWFSRVRNEGEELLAATVDPDVQHVLIQGGISYGRSGDENMADILVDLLAERAKVKTRSLLAVVINDAVEVSPKLTDGEVAILTVSFRLLLTRSPKVTNLQGLSDFLQELAPLVPLLPRGDANYLHLQSLGCGNTVSFAHTPFVDIWTHAYSGFFSNGFTEDAIPDELKALRNHNDMFMQCLWNPRKLQVNARGFETLDEIIPGTPWEPFKAQLEELMKQSMMDPEEVLDVLSGMAPEMRQLCNIWQNTMLKSLNLSAIGIAIAHANFCRLTGDESQLSTWIDEELA